MTAGWNARAAPWILWIAALLAVTALMRQWRGDIETAHVVIPFLLIVLGGSATGGRALGFTLAVGGFLLIDYYFQSPYDSLLVGKPLDWVVLVAFVATAAVATQLLARAQDEAREARRHAEEVERLSRLAEHAEALREANYLKDMLLASVSHDLRTPLTTIKALAQEVTARGETRGAVIEEQADRLSHMVGDLLDLSRLRSGAFPTHAELNAAEDLLGAVGRQFAALPGAPLRTVVDLKRPALVGRFDFVQSLRILGNLVENARRYSPAEQPIDVSVTRDGAFLVFSVADRGPGVAEAERERIFDAFYRPEHATPDSGRAGLGLAIARNLALLQDGTLTFEPRPGGGSVFVLRLPAEDVPEPPDQAL
jgi:K+-sensing histidine kinase KdpD